MHDKHESMRKYAKNDYHKWQMNNENQSQISIHFQPQTEYNRMPTKGKCHREARTMNVTPFRAEAVWHETR